MMGLATSNPEGFLDEACLLNVVHAEKDGDTCQHSGSA